MEKEVIETLAGCLAVNEPVALVTVIAGSGSSPSRTGAMMAVRTDRMITGTIGGGEMEYQAIDTALACLTTGENREITLKVNDHRQSDTVCGGEIRIFIRVFQPRFQLLIVGAGHIGVELYQLGIQQGFAVVVIDDRAEFVTRERFPRAQCIVAEDIAQALAAYPLTQNCAVTIASSSHETDRRALAAVVNSTAAYIGMIGSSKKIEKTFRFLIDQGIPRAQVAAVYAPMGLNIASILPREIAVSIISEILLVKNNGSPQHMRTVKNIKIDGKT